MRATIDTELKTVLVNGESTEEQISSFVLVYGLGAFEVKREWPYDHPNCEAILKVVRDATTYERVEKDGKIEHQFRYNCIMPNVL